MTRNTRYSLVIKYNYTAGEVYVNEQIHNSFIDFIDGNVTG